MVAKNEYNTQKLYSTLSKFLIKLISYQYSHFMPWKKWKDIGVLFPNLLSNPLDQIESAYDNGQVTTKDPLLLWMVWGKIDFYFCFIKFLSALLGSSVSF